MPPFALALVNPHAAGGRAARLGPRLRAALNVHGPVCPIEMPDTVEAALARLARLPRGVCVLVAGGDGTVNRLLPALLDGGLTLALLPSGSGNDLARALGLFGHGLEAIVAALARGQERAIDVGVAEFDGRRVPFAANLTAGFDGAVCARAIAGPRWLRGLPRYLYATFAELAALSNYEVRIEADGTEVYDGIALFASTLNTPTFGSGMPAVPHAAIDDGELDLLLARRFGRVGALAMLPRLLRGTHLSDARVRTLRYAKLSIECPGGLPVAADGEFLGVAKSLIVRACTVTRSTAPGLRVRRSTMPE
jgi:diacylglycerol kinase family enzyme